MRYQHTIATKMKVAQDYQYFKDMLQLSFNDQVDNHVIRNTKGSVAHLAHFQRDADAVTWASWLISHGYDFSYEFAM